MGKAVVASRSPGLSDYLLEGESALMVEKANPDALAEAINRLWNDPALAAEMGCRGRKFVEYEFSLEHWLVKISQILSE
jgi:glycosyltransferase involved in cell wall biosynthesis